ncbi:MAG: GGDEF domain-containing protein [Rhizobacter sp.]|nr:GGDEF domain-containing protein [Rhizobacter sp.]
MDPTTVVILLAAHLVSAGLLLYLISRRIARRSGLTAWAAGLVLFGLGLAGRLADDLLQPSTASFPSDIAMVIALLLFIPGMRQFLGKAPPRFSVVPHGVAYAALHVAVVFGLGATARFVELKLVLGLLTGLFAWQVQREGRGLAAGDPLRRPLFALSALLLAIGALNLSHSALIAQQGYAATLRGPFAQAYFGFATVFALLLVLVLLWLAFTRLNRQLVELASRDALTRVLNRNGLEDVLARHFGARDAAPLTLMQIDVDHFRRINDAQGHEAGDAVLRAVAAVLAEHVRGNDFVARTGGEEFLVGCVSTSPAAALALGERLRQGVAQLRVPWPGAIGPLRCTVSVGVSGLFTERAHWTHAARQADRALYAAKSTGRDRVVAIEGILT